MGANTAIAWTDATWNPWQGCHKVSLGCRHCYMFREKTRFGQDPETVIRSKTHTFNLPLRLAKQVKPGQPLRVFTCSWSDWWIEEADPWREEAWDIIRRTPYLTYQIVTKRIERAAHRLPWGGGPAWPNVWMIVSIENQKTADGRVPRLLDLNVAVRGVSFEPALESIDFDPWFRQSRSCANCGDQSPFGRCCDEPNRVEDPSLAWIVMGCESLPHGRVGRLPGGDEWGYVVTAREVRDRCRASGISFFQKQMPVNCRVSHDPTEWAEEDRVREFPA